MFERALVKSLGEQGKEQQLGRLLSYVMDIGNVFCKRLEVAVEMSWMHCNSNSLPTTTVVLTVLHPGRFIGRALGECIIKAKR